MTQKIHASICITFLFVLLSSNFSAIIALRKLLTLKKVLNLHHSWNNVLRGNCWTDDSVLCNNETWNSDVSMPILVVRVPTPIAKQNFNAFSFKLSLPLINNLSIYRTIKVAVAISFKSACNECLLFKAFSYFQKLLNFLSVLKFKDILRPALNWRLAQEKISINAESALSHIALIWQSFPTYVPIKRQICSNTHQTVNLVWLYTAATTAVHNSAFCKHSRGVRFLKPNPIQYHDSWLKHFPCCVQQSS